MAAAVRPRSSLKPPDFHGSSGRSRATTACDAVDACSTTIVMVQPTFAARAAGFAQQGAPSNTEQHSCLNPVTAVGCACFADICMSEQLRVRGSSMVEHACRMLYCTRAICIRERADLLSAVECGYVFLSLDTHTTRKNARAEATRPTLHVVNVGPTRTGCLRSLRSLSRTHRREKSRDF